MGVILFIVVAILYVISGYHLVTVYYRSQGIRTSGIKTNNDYARLCYITMKQPGYWIFNIANVITLFGMAMGTMIVMTDFLDSLPIPSSHPTVKRAILQALITAICLLLCLLKDPSLLVGVSSFGLIALVVSLIILFVYGVVEYGFKFESSFWYPREGRILSNLGVFVNSLAFSLMCLSQVKHLKRSYRSTITRTISLSVFTMAVIYLLIGIVFLMIYKTDDGIADNILRAIPDDSIWNMIISVLMVVTCMGSFPLYLGPIHELFDGRCGAVKTGKYFISTPVYVWLRVIEVVAISVLAFLFDNFRAVLNFIGSSTAILVCNILPALIHFLFLRKTLNKLWIVVDWLIIIVMAVVMVICTSISFKELMDTL